MRRKPTGKTCVDCGTPVTAKRCRKCAAALRSAQVIAAKPLTRCKICGDEITSANRRRGIYCSVACRCKDRASFKGAPTNRVSKTCPGCGSVFEVPVSNAVRYTYCTVACRAAHRGREALCERCGAPFRYGVASPPRRHCSEACRRPPVTIDCAHCGKTIRTTPSRESRKRFCSRRCYSASDAETSIEKAVRLVLEGERIRHVAQASVGPWVVDFLVGRLVIEADGTYWHSLRPDVDQRKTAHLESRGLLVWRIPEAEIMAAGFPARLQQRLADYEAAHGELSRLAPGEAFPAVVKGPSARRHIRSARPHPDQLTLGV